jgi:hypothetical protein
MTTLRIGTPIPRGAAERVAGIGVADRVFRRIVERDGPCPGLAFTRQHFAISVAERQFACATSQTTTSTMNVTFSASSYVARFPFHPPRRSRRGWPLRRAIPRDGVERELRVSAPASNPRSSKAMSQGLAASHCFAGSTAVIRACNFPISPTTNF